MRGAQLPPIVSAAPGAAAGVDVLLLDNRDSFTFNLAQAFAELGCDVDVVDADAVTAAEVQGARAAGSGPRLVVIGPGPRGPAELPRLVALAAALDGTVPLFGVCLGLQTLVRARGGVVGRAREPVHGKQSDVRHDGAGCFADLPAPLRVMRYHSLVAIEVPPSLTVTAVDAHGQVMALRDIGAAGRCAVEAVQFHPESIGTEGGMELLRNVVRAAGIAVPAVRQRPGTVPPAGARRPLVGENGGDEPAVGSAFSEVSDDAVET